MYLGILAIPQDRWDLAYEMLSDDRLKSGYEGEMHFRNLTTQKKADLAKRWLDRVLWDDQKCFHFQFGKQPCSKNHQDAKNQRDNTCNF